MPSSSCRHVTLAANAVAHVQRCLECDCVSLNVGAVTIRVEPRVLDALCKVLGEANVALHAQRHREASVPRGLA